MRVSNPSRTVKAENIALLVVAVASRVVQEADGDGESYGYGYGCGAVAVPCHCHAALESWHTINIDRSTTTTCALLRV